MQSIDDLLTSRAETGKRKKEGRCIRMTRRAFDKADRIGPLVKDLAGQDYEWSGFMLASKRDPDYVVQDILLQRGQDISHGNVVIDGKAVADASAEVDQINKQFGTDYYVIGWIHGHGGAWPSPSDTDVNNFGTVLNSVSLNTEQHVMVPLELIETEPQCSVQKGTVKYHGTAVEDAEIEYAFKDKKSLEGMLRGKGLSARNATQVATDLLVDLLSHADTKYSQALITGFAYFVIVNNSHAKPYTGIAERTEKAITKTADVKMYEHLPLKIVDVEGDTPITDAALTEEIEDAIKIPRKGFFGGLSALFGQDTLFGGQQHSYNVQGTQGTYPVSYDTNNPYFLSRRLFDALENRLKEARASGASVDQVAEFVDMLKQMDNARTRKEQDTIIQQYFAQQNQSAEQNPTASVKELAQESASTDRTAGIDTTKTENPT
jgi:hypothetical protein